ncbi:3-hydroxyisobutyrate dehydrogenase [Candidatus Paracaedibacter symbiosus]|uniref:3-hydroxyisobutyrate dehydrogenase n=1 Tax=Candidatus Paracaedibacter symbiosus TaxID=244582 RepID=UPI000509A102|nr:3-hydroxyisobutyrate dehydrogenase [Candidatus Paracaedibacter symbiosus]
MKKIGFIGLGHMGLPMVQNLLMAGYQVWVYDLAPQVIQECLVAGALATASAREAAIGRDVVITALPEGKHVRAVYLGEEGLLQNVKQSTLFIDCSTIDIATCQEVHELAERQGHRLLDAPMSGGVMGAKNATLTFMVGGTDTDFDAALPLLQAMGKNIFHAGAATHGLAAKICNNLMLGIQMICTSEAFNLAEKLGLDAKKLYEISSVSSGYSWSLNVYCPAPGVLPQSPATNDYKPGFTANMMLKDLKLATAEALDANVPVPLTGHAQQLYQDFCATDGQLDFSGIICYLKSLSL